MQNTGSPRFELAAIGPRAAAISLLLLVVLIPGLTLATSLLGRAPTASIAVPTAISAGICVLAWLAVVLGSRYRRIELDDAGLSVRAALYRRTLPLSALDLSQARVIDREEHPELAPRTKRNGIGIPGVYRSGHFSLRNGQRAFVVVASGRWRLWLPARQGQGLLLEVDDPRGLLATLRERAALAAHGGKG